MFGLPMTISRITPTMFLIFFGTGVAITSAGITSIVWAITRWRYIMRHGDKILTDYVVNLEHRIGELEQDKKTLLESNGALRGRLAAAKAIVES